MVGSRCGAGTRRSSVARCNEPSIFTKRIGKNAEISVHHVSRTDARGQILCTLASMAIWRNKATARPWPRLAEQSQFEPKFACASPAFRRDDFGKTAERNTPFSACEISALRWDRKIPGAGGTTPDRVHTPQLLRGSKPAAPKSGREFCKFPAIFPASQGIENMRRVGRKPRCKGTIAMNITDRAAGWSRWRCCWPDGGTRWRLPK